MHSRSRVLPILGAILGVLIVAAAIVYAARPDGHVKDAGTVVGYTAPPQPIPALWIGDSYTAGTGATQETAESCLTSRAMGWTCETDAEGGTGFVNNGHANTSTFGPLASRLRSDRDTYTGVATPQVVVIDAGRNDGAYSSSKVRAAADSYLTAVRAAWPKARLVLIVPYYLTSDASFGPLGKLYNARAEALRATVIDPIGEGWISNGKTGALTISDHVHPTPAGHRYISQHLVADLQREGLPRTTVQP